MSFRIPLTLVFLASLLPQVVSAQSYGSAAVDPVSSRVSIDKTALKADGIENALVTVTVKDTNLAAMQGKKVVLMSTRGNQDEIRIESDMTDTLGKAYFRVFSLRDGTAVFTAKVDAVTISRTASLMYSGGLTIGLTPGDLVKIPDDGNIATLNDTAVYYYAVNGKRYVFPNEKVYFTWYPTFAKVRIIPIDQMALVPIGGNVTYKPGSKLVKFQTDPKTYLVTKGGVLRWAKTEAVAQGWFGVNWNQQVDDITEAFYVNYTFGEPVESHLDLALDIVRGGTPTIDVDKGLGSIFP